MNFNLIRDPCLSWSCKTTDWLPWVPLAWRLECQRTQVRSNIPNIRKLILTMEHPGYSNVIEYFSDILCYQPKPAWRWLHVFMLLTAGRCTDTFCKHKHALWLTFHNLAAFVPTLQLLCQAWDNFSYWIYTEASEVSHVFVRKECTEHIGKKHHFRIEVR